MNGKYKNNGPQLRTAFPGEIDEFELARSFTLSDRDLGLIWQSRGAHNRLGIAMQICWLRHFGWQPSNFRKAPRSVTRFIASQLRVKAQESIERYHSIKRQQFWIYAQKAREHLGWIRRGDAERRQLSATRLAQRTTKIFGIAINSQCARVGGTDETHC